MKPITATDIDVFIDELVTYLPEGVGDVGDMADAVYIGEDIGYLEAGKQLILGVITDADFWEGFEEWRKSND